MERYKNFILILCALLLVGYGSIKLFFGNENIGSFFSKYNYNVKYVIIINDWETLPQCYKLIADIEVRGKEIRIDKADWADGKYINFIKGEGYMGELIKLNKNSICNDKDGKEWYVFLTSYKSLPVKK